MRNLICLVILFLCISSWAQSPTSAPRFEVASIRPVAKDTRDNNGAIQGWREFYRDHRRPGEIPRASPDRIVLKDWATLDLVAAAYSVRPGQVFGPDWMSNQRFDIEATMPVDTPKEALNTMLQLLLEERFGLQVHHTSKAGSGFALTVGKGGPRLLPAASPPADSKKLSNQDEQVQLQKRLQVEKASMEMRMEEMRANGNSLGSFRSETMPAVTTEELAADLIRYTGAPVIDATGLLGRYSVVLEVSTGGNEPGNTIFDAVEKLGLKLEPRKVTIKTIVVDHVSKLPTQN